MTTAKNRAIDRLRRDRVLAAKLRLLIEATTPAVMAAAVRRRAWTTPRSRTSGLS